MQAVTDFARSEPDETTPSENMIRQEQQQDRKYGRALVVSSISLTVAVGRGSFPSDLQCFPRTFLFFELDPIYFNVETTPFLSLRDNNDSSHLIVSLGENKLKIFL